ncbi:MAG: hypothetical protein QXO27_03460 [Candidatus Aenigmatarchaeota archaeon]
MRKKLIILVMIIALVTFVTTVSACCAEGYLDAYRCNANVRQQLYQYTDCSTEWRDIENCDYGCFSGQCQPRPTCNSQYLDSYSCSGNWRQQLYQYSDCRTEWRDIEYCDYRCYSGSCISPPSTSCSISATVDKPYDVNLGETIYTTITLTNSGDRGGYTEVSAYLCDSDYSNCRIMDCESISGDQRIYVSAKSSISLTCYKTKYHEGYYRIKVNFDDCNYMDKTIYTDIFRVYPIYRPSYVYYTSVKPTLTGKAVYVDEIKTAIDISKPIKLEEEPKIQVVYQTQAVESLAPVAIIIILLLILVLLLTVFVPFLMKRRSWRISSKSESENHLKVERVPFLFGGKFRRKEPEKCYDREC